MRGVIFIIASFRKLIACIVKRGFQKHESAGCLSLQQTD